MLWEFPSEFLRCFSKVTIATYMFDASPFAAYLKNEGFKFNRQTVNGNLTTPSLVPWDDAKPIEAALKARLRELITVASGSANAIGKELPHSHPFSAGWIGRQTADVLKKVQASTSNFFLEVAKAPANKVAWTTVKEHRTSLKGRGYARSNRTGPHSWDQGSLNLRCNLACRCPSSIKPLLAASAVGMWATRLRCPSEAAYLQPSPPPRFCPCRRATPPSASGCSSPGEGAENCRSSSRN
jgi:hypothetical protein